MCAGASLRTATICMMYGGETHHKWVRRRVNYSCLARPRSICSVLGLFPSSSHHLDLHRGLPSLSILIYRRHASYSMIRLLQSFISFAQFIGFKPQWITATQSLTCGCNQCVRSHRNNGSTIEINLRHRHSQSSPFSRAHAQSNAPLKCAHFLRNGRTITCDLHYAYCAHTQHVCIGKYVFTQTVILSVAHSFYSVANKPLAVRSLCSKQRAANASRRHHFDSKFTAARTANESEHRPTTIVWCRRSMEAIERIALEIKRSYAF